MNFIQFNVPVTKNRQQRGGSVIIQAGIVNQTTIEWFKVNEGIKLNCANYCNFMDKTFFACYKCQSHSFIAKCVFIHDNAPSDVSKFTCEFFEHK